MPRRTSRSSQNAVSVRFQPIGSAPILKQKVFKISASSRFSVVLNFLRKKVGIKEGDGLFCYVNAVFAPGLDEGVGNLYRVWTTWPPRGSEKKGEERKEKGVREGGAMANAWSSDLVL